MGSIPGCARFIAFHRLHPSIKIDNQNLRYKKFKRQFMTITMHTAFWSKAWNQTNNEGPQFDHSDKDNGH